jgi:CheY-like chemotaxis protein
VSQLNGQSGRKGGSGPNLNPNMVFNLSKASVMVVDDEPFSLRLIAQTLLGFGVKSRHQCASADEAMALLKSHPVDLLIVDTEMPDKDGYDLVHWLRRSGLDNAWVPAVMISGHTPQSKVAKARDCGANFIVARPLTPAVLLDRILWVARDIRPMLEAGDYSGPDRRFKDQGPPEGQAERRGDAISRGEVTLKEEGARQA